MRSKNSMLWCTGLILCLSLGTSPSYAQGHRDAPTLRLLLKKRWLSVDGNHVIYRPDSNRRKSHYKVYQFHLQEFQSKAGDPTQWHTKMITCTIQKISRRSHQIPVGTIHTTTTLCGLSAPIAQRPIAQRPIAQRPIHLRIHSRIRRSKRFPNRVFVHYRLPREKYKLLSLSVTGKTARLRLRSPLKYTKHNGKKYAVIELIPTHVKSATYIKVLIPSANFRKNFPQKTFQSAVVLLTFTSITKRIYVPQNPGISAPWGGFRFFTLTAHIRKVESLR